MNHNRTTRFLAPLAASALIFSLAACGSDDTGSSDTVAEATPETTPEATPETTMADDMSSDNTTMTSDDMGGEMDDDMTEMPGGEATVGDITVTGAWVREPAEGQTLSAGYGTITNNGDTDLTLVSASVPFGATVEIHETTMDADGKMQMQEVPEGFVVPAGGAFTLEPVGPHIMLIDIDPADITGTVELTMVFDDGTEVTVAAPVKPLDMSEMGDIGDDMGGDMTGTTMAG